MNAVINTMAPTKERLHYEWFGEWDTYINGGLQKKDEDGLGVRVWATLKGEQEPREVEVLLKPVTVRNSPNWKSDPRQQIAYLAVKRWSRLYCPDVILGVYTPDELTPPEEKAINAAPAGRRRTESLLSRLQEKESPHEQDALVAVLAQIASAETESALAAVETSAKTLEPEQMKTARAAYKARLASLREHDETPDVPVDTSEDA
ncbi:recombinase RecT [Veronia nyctiphanis]|uniref:recombinase RecT n=1 Tax=Veronia nyctiphanis TaxID=1278244 RepID=UPI0022A83061|nr:recombinase RecT [Veronia nyctiphanis]